MVIKYRGIFTISEQIKIVQTIKDVSEFDEAHVSKLKNNNIKIVLKKI